MDQYPLPCSEDLFATLAGGVSFSKLDISHAYNQRKTPGSFRQSTRTEDYITTRLPFGVASPPVAFQTTMDILLHGMESVVCYIDDILFARKTKEQHLANVKVTLKHLREHGVGMKKSECVFLQTSVEYLGHKVAATEIHATDDKLEAIKKAPSPQNLPQLRSFLGLVNYYGKYIPNLPSLLQPLNQFLSKSLPGSGPQNVRKHFTQLWTSYLQLIS